MAKPQLTITPPDRLTRWKKLWGTPRLLDQDKTDALFEEFTDAVVPTHMHKLFLKSFGVPKARFGNRFFRDEAQFIKWQTRFSHVGIGESVALDAIAIYASPERLEAYGMKGESRRSLKDLVIDDWFAVCAIVRSPSANVYIFVEPRMEGCIVRIVPLEPEDKETDEDSKENRDL